MTRVVVFQMTRVAQFSDDEGRAILRNCFLLVFAYDEDRANFRVCLFLQAR